MALSIVVTQLVQNYVIEKRDTALYLSEKTINISSSHMVERCNEGFSIAGRELPGRGGEERERE